MLTALADMFGFKLEATRREGDVSQKARPIYLDMQVSSHRATPTFFQLIVPQATTPVDPRVLDAMLPFLTDQFGNPHSRTHAYGWEAEKAVEDARKVRDAPNTLYDGIHCLRSTSPTSLALTPKTSSSPRGRLRPTIWPSRA